jgi:5-formyltetrahydrofolate cyclo-ligase
MTGVSKDHLRSEIRRRLKSLDEAQFLREGELAAGALTVQSCWISHQTVLIFLSSKFEINTEPLLRAALSQGKRVYAPQIEGEYLRFYRVRGAGGPWRRGLYGIREPEGNDPAAYPRPWDFPALIVLPGLAFDRSGGRLGQGKAYYDRFLADLDARSRPYFAVGFCMEAQVYPRVPVESRDKPVNALCSGSGFFRIDTNRNGAIE